MTLGKTANQRLRAFLKRLGPEFDNFARRGTKLIETPVRNVLAGYHFDFTATGDDQRWLYVFAHPLYIPQDYTTLGFGHRIPTDWQTVYAGSEDEELINETVSLLSANHQTLSSWSSDSGFYEYLNLWGRSSKSMYRGWWYEALIGVCIILGKESKAIENINGFWNFTSSIIKTYENLRDVPDYVHEQRIRVSELEKVILNSGSGVAMDILSERRRFSVNALDIGDLTG